MKKFILAACAVFLLTGLLSAEELKAPDQNKLFYVANASYEKREYARALEDYNKILKMGIESGHLYYNMGNCYFKLGKLGSAILFYEKASRIMPYDGDLKANLNYAQSLVEPSTADIPRKNPVVSMIKAPFKDFSMNAMALFGLLIFLVFAALQAAFILNPVLARKARLIYALIVALLAVNIGAFAIRYYDDEILKRGIVIQKSVECKYEPIDKSTTFYKLQEGEEVSIIKTREGWRQIKRIDGKIGWAEQGAIEEI